MGFERANCNFLIGVPSLKGCDFGVLFGVFFSHLFQHSSKEVVKILHFLQHLFRRCGFWCDFGVVFEQLFDRSTISKKGVILVCFFHTFFNIVPRKGAEIQHLLLLKIPETRKLIIFCGCI